MKCKNCKLEISRDEADLNHGLCTFCFEEAMIQISKEVVQRYRRNRDN